MPSIRSTVLAAAFVAATYADYIIDPETVSLSMRKRWCEDQTNTCPTICASVDDRKVMVNECDPEALTYGCICGNGKQPNMTHYTLTLPYHTCTEYGTQCVDSCPEHDNECARACREDNPCGAQDPQKPTGTKTAAAKPSATGEDEEDDDEVFEGLAGADDSDDKDDKDDKGSAGRREVGGLVVVMGALFAGVAML